MHECLFYAVKETLAIVVGGLGGFDSNSLELT